MNTKTELYKIEIEVLFAKAKNLYASDSKKSQRFIQKARGIAQKHQYRLSSKLRRKYCHNCYQVLIPSVNCIVRTQNSCIVYTCNECKHFNKFRIKS